MLAGIDIGHCQPDFNRFQLQHKALRTLCLKNGIDSTAVLFCKQEHLLASIKDHYCQVNLYNDFGFQIEPLTKGGFVELAQLEFVFENLNPINTQQCDSSRSIELEQDNWIIGNDFSLKNSFVIVYYWSARKFLQEQLTRMKELQNLKTNFSHISIRLIFINQDFIP